MNKYLTTLASTAIALGCLATTASADEITINYTGDNIVFNGVCANESCLGYSILAPGTNHTNWKVADTQTVNLGTGTHWLLFQVHNVGPYGSNNPGALLAEILWANSSVYSSSDWDVSTNLIDWTSATEYGTNGGNNIWTDVNGGNAIAGISNDANWIWTAGQDNHAFFRTSIMVPEPGTLALLGAGLAGIGFARRKARR